MIAFHNYSGADSTYVDVVVKKLQGTFCVFRASRGAFKFFCLLFIFYRYREIGCRFRRVGVF